MEKCSHRSEALGLGLVSMGGLRVRVEPGNLEGQGRRSPWFCIPEKGVCTRLQGAAGSWHCVRGLCWRGLREQGRRLESVSHNLEESEGTQ